MILKCHIVAANWDLNDDRYVCRQMQRLLMDSDDLYLIFYGDCDVQFCCPITRCGLVSAVKGDKVRLVFWFMATQSIYTLDA